MAHPLNFPEGKIRTVDEDVAQKVLGGAKADQNYLKAEDKLSERQLNKAGEGNKAGKGVRINFLIDPDVYEALMDMQCEYRKQGRTKEATVQKLANDGLRSVLKEFMK